MKYKIYLILFVVFSAMILVYTGCEENFLDISPKESTSVDSFFSSQSDAQAAINATYASLQSRSLYSELYPKTVEGASDDMGMDNTDNLSLSSYTWTVTLRTTDSNWQSCYEGIFRANLVIKNVPNIDMDEDLKSRIIGEAHFLRALYYWHLMTLFGEVPLVTEEQADPADPSKAELPKSSPSKIIDFMVADLKKAESALPASYDDNNVGRATKGAAQALLGKVYLYSTSPLFGGNADGYGLAADELKKVIDAGNYSLIDYKNLWVQDNNAESIFEVQYADVGGSIWYSSDNAGANEVNLRAALDLPNTRGGNGNLLPTQSLVDEFEDYSGPDPEGVFNGRDPRLYYTVWRDGDYFDDVEPTYKSSWTPTGYALKKGLFPVPDRNEDGTVRNIPVIRFGDVLLMYAEAVNAKSPREPQEAIDALNRVRERVNMPDYPTTDYPITAASNEQAIFDVIVHERRVELAGEYQRFNDLRRWGLAKQVLGPLGYEAPRDNFFPIPPDEVDNNDQLEQNPNY